MVVVTISADLPIMQRSWCDTAGLENAVTVSDAYDMAIGSAYGTYLENLRLDQRALLWSTPAAVVCYTSIAPRSACTRTTMRHWLPCRP